MPPIETTRIFIDESGSPDPFIYGKHQEHDKYFTVAAVVMKQSVYIQFKKGLRVIQEKYEPYIHGKEIKSNYIRCSNPKTIKQESKPPEYTFYKERKGQKIYNSFCLEIKELLKSTDFKIISVTVDKEGAGKKYPNFDLHYIMLCDLWERIAIYYALNDKPKIKILFDRTKCNADLVLKKSYKNFKESGTWYWGKERLAVLNLDKDVYSADSERSKGLQLADLCAHPIKKRVEHGSHEFYSEVIESKIHGRVTDKTTNKTINMGIKKCLR